MEIVTLKDIGKLREFWRRFSNREYRHAFAESRLRESVAAQVYFIRESRKLTQGELAARVGTKQPAISRIERGDAALTATSLEAIARAFDVALSIKFVPFSEIAEEVIAGRIEAYVPEFSDDVPAGLVDIAPYHLPKLRYSGWENGTEVETQTSASASNFVRAAQNA